MLTWVYDNMINTMYFIVALMSLAIAAFMFLAYLIVYDKSK